MMRQPQLEKCCCQLLRTNIAVSIFVCVRVFILLQVSVHVKKKQRYVIGETLSLFARLLLSTQLEALGD